MTHLPAVQRPQPMRGPPRELKRCRRVDPTLAELLSQPQALAVMSIQFFLGLGLGYVSVKALKYVLAFIAILALGSFLSVWSLGATPLEVLEGLGVTALKAKDLLMGLATALGLMTVGPASAGFVVGVVVALVKK